MVNVIIEPYEPLIYQAIQLIEQKKPNYFNGIERIVLEPGDPGHFGKVESDKPNQIFISVQKIRAALTAGNEDDIVRQIAETLAHEVGHIRAGFEGGEAPAVQEEEAIRNVLTTSLNRQLRAARYAQTLKRYSKQDITRLAVIENRVQSQDLASAILRVVYHFGQKVNPENQKDYLRSIQNKLHGIDPTDLANKKKNPGAGVGASLSLIKNMLTGQDLYTINHALALVYEGIGML